MLSKANNKKNIKNIKEREEKNLPVLFVLLFCGVPSEGLAKQEDEGYSFQSFVVYL